MSKKILLINHYAGSPDYGMEYRPYYFAREWVKHGHEVTILAASYSHLRSKNPPIGKREEVEWIDGIRYIWLSTPSYEGNGLGRIRNIMAFLAGLTRKISDLRREKFDLVIASSTYPLDVSIAYQITRGTPAKLVYEVHDLWPLSPIELGGMSKWHPFIQAMQWAENFAYKNSDIVVSLLPAAKSHMVEHGMKPSKFVYIPNGVFVSDWDPAFGTLPDDLLSRIESDKKEGQFLIAYAGAHGIANALETLLLAANELKNEPVAFYFIGPGPERERLLKKSAELGLANTRFFEAIPKTLIPQALSKFDALYIGLQKQSLFRFGVSPNKLMDYMMAAKPVIYAVEAGNDPVTSSGCGISVHAESPEAVAAAIRTMRGLDPQALFRMGENGRKFVVENHDYHKLAVDFLALIG